MPIMPLPELSENPAAVFGEGDLAICDPVELANGSLALLFFQREKIRDPLPGQPKLHVDLKEEKADLALVFQSTAAVDQMAAVLAELHNLLLRSGRVTGEAEPSAFVGAYLSVERLHRGIRGLLAEWSFFDPKTGDVIQTSELRRFLDRLDDEFYGVEPPIQRARRNELRSLR